MKQKHEKGFNTQKKKRGQEQRGMQATIEMNNFVFKLDKRNKTTATPSKSRARMLKSWLDYALAKSLSTNASIYMIGFDSHSARGGANIYFTFHGWEKSERKRKEYVNYFTRRGK